MTRREFVEKLFGTRIFTQYPHSVRTKGCEGFACPQDFGCDVCEYADFWNKEVSLAEVYANISTSDAGKMLYKGFLNSMYGTVNIGRRNGKTYTIEHLMSLSGWQRFPRILETLDFADVHDIVDDALDNGFEFKVYNSTLYYREKDYANTDSVQDID